MESPRPLDVPHQWLREAALLWAAHDCLCRVSKQEPWLADSEAVFADLFLLPLKANSGHVNYLAGRLQLSDSTRGLSQGPPEEEEAEAEASTKPAPEQKPAGRSRLLKFPGRDFTGEL